MSEPKIPPFHERSTKTPRSPTSTKRPNPREPSCVPDNRTRNQRNHSNSDTEVQPNTSEQESKEVTTKSKSKPNKEATRIESVQKEAKTQATRVQKEANTEETQELITTPEQSQKQDKQDTQTPTLQNQTVLPKETGKDEIIKSPALEKPDITNEQVTGVNRPIRVPEIAQTQAQIQVTLSQSNNKRKLKMAAAAREVQKTITNLVPEFSGEGGDRVNTDLTRFLGLADSAFNTLETAEEKKTFGELIKFRLTGNAYERIANRQLDDYKAFRAALNNMYTRIVTLSELERKFVEIKQAYGESARNFGQRVTEALECYKNGYRRKYNIVAIDDAYTTHLQNTAVLTFKKGLNNTILKDKVATIKARDIDEIMEQTEDIERMLTITTGQPTYKTAYEEPQPRYINKVDRNQYQYRNNPVICNYCSKPNHTYDTCRTRIWSQNRPQFQTNQQNNTNQYNPRYNQGSTRPYAVQTSNTPRNQYQTSFQNYNRIQPTQPSNQDKPTYNNFRRPPDQRYTMDRPPKYCSFCKTTVGHTFEECRSKFQNNQTQNNPVTYNSPRPQSGNGALVEKFENMRINLVSSQPQVQDETQYIQEQQSGNEHGLAQTK